MKYLITTLLLFVSFVVSSQYHVYINNWYVVPDTTQSKWSFDDVYYNEFPYHPHTVRINGNKSVNTIHLFFDVEKLTMTTSYIQYDGHEYMVSIEYIAEWGMWTEDEFTTMFEMLSGNTYLYIDDYDKNYDMECTPQFVKENIDGSVEYIVKNENKDYFGKKSLKVIGFN